ncbi:winged helix-turn-helix domain-containing protein [Paenibacillus alvei]|uniref:winged helix-turn-helix domain-containing protein n=1 Tax=Paenibacillus alvei TaxID=44250 RepID=UPI0022823B5C|nr:winged helix-turn-helix domain-containing protein [Paenibacillus alvei]MCY7482820.1 winged helix-turn-helix domain-containing protein [Paenibacillus alvei]
MELSVYTNNHFFFTYVSHLFNDKMKLTHIQDCHRFREAIACATSRSVFLLDANQIEDDTCFTRMMTETKVPIMIVNPEEKDTLKKMMMWEQSISGMLGDESEKEHTRNRHAIDNAVVLDDNRTLFQVANHSIQKNGVEHILSTLEFKLLYHLVQQDGQPVSAHELADSLDTSEGVLYIYIKKVREKIEENPSQPTILQHIRGKGYVLHIAGYSKIAPVEW